jgi:hypothetical protein
MQPSYWCPPVPFSVQEEQIAQRRRRAKLFVFLRAHRHELFDEAFRAANLQRSTGQVSGGIHPSLLHNWPWRSFCKHTRASPTTK